MALSFCAWCLLAVPAPAALGAPPPKGAIQLRHGGSVTSLVFLPDGKTLISASGDRLIRLWDPATGQERRRLEGHTAAVRSLALAPDGNQLASGGDDSTVRFWDLAAGKETRLIQGHRRDVTSLTFSPDGTHFASADADLPRVKSPYL
jgi:WD40 repeat protein